MAQSPQEFDLRGGKVMMSHKLRTLTAALLAVLLALSAAAAIAAPVACA